MLVVAVDPPRLEVKILEELDKVLVVYKLVIVKLVALALVKTEEEAFKLFVLVVLALMSIAKIFVVKRSVK